MQNHKSKSKSFYFLIVLLTFVFLLLSLFAFRQPKTSANLDSFAKCLAEKEITMYGAVWCPHCQSQKKLFGKSFDLVPYVECPNTPKLCLDKGVKGYPTWIAPDGSRLEGQQPLQNLSEFSGCSLP